MKPHPIAEIFPDIEGTEFCELVEDIKRRGLVQPLVMYQGKILDGRNRWRACQKLGIKPKTVDYRGDDPIGHVLALNLSRRHLTESQRAMVAAKVATMPHGGDRKAENQDANLRLDRTITEAAKSVSVSPRSVDAAKAVLSDGTPALARAVERGEIPVSVAAKIAKTPPAKQREAVDGGREVAREIARAASAPKDKPAKPPIYVFPGVDIPKGLLERAARDIVHLDAMDKLCRDLARMTTEFEKSRPEDDPQGAPGKQRRRWREQLEMLAHLIRSEKPESICPYCKALPKHSKNCGVCKGKGYGPKQANTPKELWGEGDDCGIYVNGKWELLDLGF
jgi:hypothetical protein